MPTRTLVRNNTARIHARSSGDAYFFFTLAIVIMLLLAAMVYSYFQSSLAF